jgi:AcrR family transcriptional regulator
VSGSSRPASSGRPWATLGGVGSLDVATEREAGPVAPSAAQARIIAAALDLFTRHGVGGTSLQMIADRIGVTKAAVYHQYKTKDEIVLAAAEAELARLEAVVAAAETERSGTRARDVLLNGMVDLAVESRRTVSTILTDPVIGGFFAEHEAFRDVMQRLRRLLVGDDVGPEARVRIAMLIASTSGAVMHPFVADLDDDTLRAELLRLARRFLGLRA